MRARADPGVFLFAGPTLAASTRARSILRGVRVLPPVRRLDVSRLVSARRRPGTIAIVDGRFHDTLAVGHVEIRDALARGWQVWGLSSMGAIRAREMVSMGMRGFGQVFERFVADGDFQDDEVALLHGPAPRYRRLTEPLIHIRAAADHLLTRGLADASKVNRVIAALKARWYGERTRREAVDSLCACAIGREAAVARELHDFRRFELKTIDLEAFLRQRPWLHP